MPTTPLAGDRARRARNPRDVTGTRHRELLAEKAAKDALKDTDIEAVKRAEFQRGFDAAWETAFKAGWDALAAYLVEEGVLDSDDTDDADEQVE